MSHGEFTPEEGCDCRVSSYFSEVIVDKEVPMMGDESPDAIESIEEALSNITGGLTDEFNGGLAPPFHRCIEVAFKCDDCSKSFRKTYELHASAGKQNRPGFYARVRKEMDVATRRIAYDDVEHFYDELSGAYDPVNWNCIHFAVALWEKLMEA